MLKRFLGLAALFAVGAAIATVGALSHRAFPYIGVALVILVTFTGAVFSRAWKDWGGLALYSSGWAVTVFLLAQRGPGGSVLIVEDALGLVFLLGSTAMIVLVALIPSFLLKGREDVA
ncbi:DUF6113 family protein [Demequina capsici]|uniref:DUF6113 family protein n=1 Tax=Demequina capsici TaxID=3075620 RepID=A0AA96FGD1_9MICO|nr:DUF6113 family protein [Demequina sp. PMTSA13]WNM28016.1 DUF6113 family protein [Demequina sp. PMTSA13]